MVVQRRRSTLRREKMWVDKRVTEGKSEKRCRRREGTMPSPSTEPIKMLKSRFYKKGGEREWKWKRRV